jgi:hypothetical protein
MPLYKQLWHAQIPSVTFLGLPHSIVPFPLFELQSEAILAKLLDRTSFPPLEERMAAANRDAQAGGFKKTGCVVDTHFLGSGQWDYCRDMAKMAGLYDDKMEKYIATNMVCFAHSMTVMSSGPIHSFSNVSAFRSISQKTNYDHAMGERALPFPGGPDVFRSTCYIRDEEHQTFHVTSTKTDDVLVESR